MRTANHASRSTLHASPLFEDVTVLLQHTHHEEEFDDYAGQPLLPYKLSQLGPGVAWFDIDGDGHDDLIIGTGRGGQLAAIETTVENFSGVGCRPDDRRVPGSDDGAGLASARRTIGRVSRLRKLRGRSRRWRTGAAIRFGAEDRL